jgi:hypothetical protein
VLENALAKGAILGAAGGTIVGQKAGLNTRFRRNVAIVRFVGGDTAGKPRRRRRLRVLSI